MTKIICNQCGKEKEGTQVGLCSQCGRFGKTNRELALKWWYELGDGIGEMADKYHKGCETIQQFQIEEIWEKEIKK